MSSFRRRLALLIDGSLTQPTPSPEPDYVGWKLSGYGLRGIEEQLTRINKHLANLDRKAQRRRMRVIECRHPELHPEYPEMHQVS